MVDGVSKICDPRDVVHGDDDPSPKTSDQAYEHGTAAAGVAAAAGDNGLDVTGIAPGCRLMPIQLYAESTFTPNSTEADAFLWAADHGAAVMSNSWGPDNADTPLPDATRAAIDHATTAGRGGKGVAIFFAAGNSNSDTSHDSYISYPGVISIAASNNVDTRAGYSCFGAAVAVAAPSSGGTLGITTTDVTGNPGYAQGNVTFGFGGTSSACPLAAGVAALVLSVNPSLTWQQVKAVLEQSADKIDVDAGGYDAAGRSDLYGFGRVNAYAAVRLAQEFNAEAPQALLHLGSDLVGAGGTYRIDWSTVAPSPLASQTLEYSTDNGATFSPIATPAPGTQVFVWSVPEALAGALLVRLTVVDTNGKSASDAKAVTAWARPTISKVKLKQPAGGKRSLVVDGANFRVGEASVYVGDVELTDVSVPSNRTNGDGTATRLVSKDPRLKTLIKGNVSVTVRHARANQSSAPYSFTK
jgi:hypothetical protein